jgi:hypothetical protein
MKSKAGSLISDLSLSENMLLMIEVFLPEKARQVATKGGMEKLRLPDNLGDSDSDRFPMEKQGS